MLLHPPPALPGEILKIVARLNFFHLLDSPLLRAPYLTVDWVLPACDLP